MKRLFSEKGAIMVEATIYFPLVICTVIALFYLAFFNMQEYMMMYEAQRVAAVVARETAYPGYVEFGMGENHEIDFEWGEAKRPPDEQISSYYTTYNSSLKELYREITKWFKGYPRDYESHFSNAARESAIIVLGSISEPIVEIKRGILGNDVTVTFTHSLPTPGVIRYLGINQPFTIKSTAYSYAVNPTSFVRNVNFATDMTSYVFEKMGIDEKFNGILEKMDKIIGQVL